MRIYMRAALADCRWSPLNKRRTLAKGENEHQRGEG